MIYESAIEALAVDLITQGSGLFVQLNPDKPYFRVVKSVGMDDIDADNLREFVKTTPACLVECAGDSAEDLANTGESQRRLWRILVYVVARGAVSPGATSDDVNALSRSVIHALRGMAFDMGGHQMGDFRYRESTPKNRVENWSGMLMKALSFEFRAIDHPLV